MVHTRMTEEKKSRIKRVRDSKFNYVVTTKSWKIMYETNDKDEAHGMIINTNHCLHTTLNTMEDCYES
jgi:hypothetical protein